MSDTVRTLIRSAYMRSGILGLGATPDDHETKFALDLLNDILGVLSRQEGFSPGKVEKVLDVPAKGYVTFSDNPHRVFMATADENGIRCMCRGSHDLVVGDEIDARVGGIDMRVAVSSVESFREFTIPANGYLSGRFIGSFKLASQEDEYVIDIVGQPPENIYKVVGSGSGEIPKCDEQFFYAGVVTGDYWFYRKGNMPYPRLYVEGSSRVKIVYSMPSLCKVGLDTDLTWLDEAQDSALIYRLAADIAGARGFEAREKSLMARYRNAYATYMRSREEDAEALPDTSMAGYGACDYNIFTDGAGNEQF